MKPAALCDDWIYDRSCLGRGTQINGDVIVHPLYINLCTCTHICCAFICTHKHGHLIINTKMFQKIILNGIFAFIPCLSPFPVFVWKTSLWYYMNLFPCELKTFFSRSTYHSKILSYQGTLINWDYIRPFLYVLFSRVILELPWAEEGEGRPKPESVRISVAQHSYHISLLWMCLIEWSACTVEKLTLLFLWDIFIALTQSEGEQFSAFFLYSGSGFSSHYVTFPFLGFLCSKLR